MKFTVSTYDIRTFTSVLWYCEKLKNNIEHHMYLDKCIYSDMDDNELIDYIAYDKDFTVFYKDIEFKMNRKTVGEPVWIQSRGEVGNYEEIEINIESDKLSDDEIIEITKDFIQECKEKYHENRKLKNNNDNIFLWSYSDGFWDNIKKIKKRDIETVILDKEIKNEVNKCLDNYGNKDLKERLNKLGINLKMNIVFSGLPGTGKSSLMFAIASELNKDIATIDFNNRDLNDHGFICATNKIPKNSIFVLEDIDALYISRNKSDENRVSFSCILNFLDGVYSKENLISIITTNHLNKLDKAIIRPMRINSIINFTYCSKYQYNEIFKLIFPDENEIREKLYKIIKNKKYTTSMLQKFLIKYIFNPEELVDNIKIFEEYIQMCSEKEPDMFI